MIFRSTGLVFLTFQFRYYSVPDFHRFISNCNFNWLGWLERPRPEMQYSCTERQTSQDNTNQTDRAFRFLHIPFMVS